MRHLFLGGFYPRVVSIQGLLLFKGGFYSRAASFQGLLLFKGGFFSRSASFQGRLHFKGRFYVASFYLFFKFDTACISFYDVIALQVRRIVEFRVYV